LPLERHSAKILPISAAPAVHCSFGPKNLDQVDLNRSELSIIGDQLNLSDDSVEGLAADVSNNVHESMRHRDIVKAVLQKEKKLNLLEISFHSGADSNGSGKLAVEVADEVGEEAPVNLVKTTRSKETRFKVEPSPKTTKDLSHHAQGDAAFFSVQKFAVRL